MAPHDGPSDPVLAGVRRGRARTDYRPLLWLLVAYGPFLLNDALYMSLSDWRAWMAVDYGSRLIVLAIMAAVPTLRAAAFVREPLTVSHLHAAIMVIGCIAFDRLLNAGFTPVLSLILGTEALAQYPDLPPGIRQLDLFVGMMFVAASEEILCRRCAKNVLQRYFGDRAVIAISAVLFGMMHWSYGLHSVITITLLGGVMMTVYLRIGSVLPLIAAHYAIDVIAFW